MCVVVVIVGWGGEGRGGGCYQLVRPGLTALPLSPTTPFPPPLVPTAQPPSTPFSPPLSAVLPAVVPSPPFVSLYAQLLQPLAQQRFWLHRRTAILPGLGQEGKSRPLWQTENQGRGRGGDEREVRERCIEVVRRNEDRCVEVASMVH